MPCSNCRQPGHNIRTCKKGGEIVPTTYAPLYTLPRRSARLAAQDPPVFYSSTPVPIYSSPSFQYFSPPLAPIRGRRPVLEEDELPFEVRGTAINTDWSNRSSLVRTYQALLKELGRAASNEFSGTDVFAFSEMGATSAKKLGYSLSKATGKRFDGEAAKLSYEHSALSWDSSKLTRDSAMHRAVHSTMGKYLAVLLENEEKRKKVLCVAVHLPQRKQEQCFNLLQGFIEESKAKYDIDDVLMMGDWNCRSERLSSELPEFSFAFGAEDGPTTKAGNRIDNLGSCASSIRSKEILSDYNVFSHFPISALFSFPC